jgi:hypothetical protein
MTSNKKGKKTVGKNENKRMSELNNNDSNYHNNKKQKKSKINKKDKGTHGRKSNRLAGKELAS